MAEVRPCQYLNERWYPGWGKAYRESALGALEASSYEIRCVKPQKWGGVAEELSTEEVELCKSSTSSRCWRKH